MINPRKSRTSLDLRTIFTSRSRPSQHDSLSSILVDEYSFFLFERPIATYKSARLDPVIYEYS